MTPDAAESSATSCLHAPCDCPAQGDSSYCSERCRTDHLAGTASGPCHCGHADCGGERGA